MDALDGKERQHCGGHTDGDPDGARRSAGIANRSQQPVDRHPAARCRNWFDADARRVTERPERVHSEQRRHPGIGGTELPPRAGGPTPQRHAQQQEHVGKWQERRKVCDGGHLGANQHDNQRVPNGRHEPWNPSSGDSPRRAGLDDAGICLGRIETFAVGETHVFSSSIIMASRNPSGMGVAGVNYSHSRAGLLSLSVRIESARRQRRPSSPK